MARMAKKIPLPNREYLSCVVSMLCFQFFIVLLNIMVERKSKTREFRR